MRRIVLVFGASVLVACQGAPPVQSFRNGADINRVSEEESRLWVEADRFDIAMRKQGALYGDAETTAYVQSVMDRLYPEFKGKIHVRIVNSPVLNAFALPNGSIYFDLGLLARLDNEAQLATVLAHEGAHFIQKHGLKQRRNVKDASVFALGVAAVGIPLLGDLAAYSSIYGFSRDLERDADRAAFERMRRAGYDTAEAAITFRHLLDEVKALKIDEPYFFSSHPKLQERIDSFEELAKTENGPAARVGRREYLDKTRRLRVASLEAELSLDRYQSVILVLGNPQVRARYPAYSLYYLGEAYRRRGQEGDDDKAVAAYRQALAAAPDFAPSYRAVGIYYMKRKQYAEARRYFEDYLRLAPEGKHAAYVQQYLSDIQREIKGK